jgi:vitamin B12 transporter
MNKTLGAVAATLLTTTSALAQEPVFQLPEIIFSAGLTAIEANRTGVSVEVVDEDDLDAAGDVQLSDYLETLPGISVTQNGPVGTNTTLRIRGLNGNYIPVLINGIDVTDPSSTQTNFNFGTLTTGGISRIEVLYGSQSAIYGSEAIGGVINITTLQAPDENGTDIIVNAEGGTYDSYLGEVGIATRFDRGTLAFSATRVVTDGFSAADENLGNTEADGYESTTLSFTGTYELSETVTIGGSVIYLDSRSDFDSGGGAGRDSDRFLTSEQLGARIFAQFDGIHIDHEIAVQAFRIDRSDPNSTSSVTNFEGDRLGFSYRGTIDLAGEQGLVIGADYTREDYLSFGTGGRTEADYSVATLLGEYTTRLGNDVDLALAVRYDEHSVFGGATTGRAALAWRPDASTTIRASIATGFRAPSLNELYGPFGAPNPNLQPEESRSAELAIEREFANGRVGAALFYTEIDDLIDYRGTGYVQVPGKTVSRGIELTGELALNDNYSLFGNYTYTDSEEISGNRLARVPLHDLTLGLRAEFNELWTGTVTVQHVAGRQDRVFGPPPTFASTPFDMPDYTVANMSLGYAVNDATEVYLRVENIFDEEYQTTLGYGTSDRAFYLGVRASF